MSECPVCNEYNNTFQYVLLLLIFQVCLVKTERSVKIFSRLLINVKEQNQCFSGSWSREKVFPVPQNGMGCFPSPIPPCGIIIKLCDLKKATHCFLYTPSLDSLDRSCQHLHYDG